MVSIASPYITLKNVGRATKSIVNRALFILEHILNFSFIIKYRPDKCSSMLK